MIARALDPEAKGPVSEDASGNYYRSPTDGRGPRADKTRKRSGLEQEQALQSRLMLS